MQGLHAGGARPQGDRDTRSPGKADLLGTLGATPVIVDGLDADGLLAAVRQARPR